MQISSLQVSILPRSLDSRILSSFVLKPNFDCVIIGRAAEFHQINDLAFDFGKPHNAFHERSKSPPFSGGLWLEHFL